MKIRAVKAYHDARVHLLGDVYEEDDATAKQRIKAGLAVKAEEPELKKKAKS